MRRGKAPGGEGLFTGRLAVVALLTAAVAGSATVFGYGFAPEAHGHEPEATAEAVEEPADEAGEHVEQEGTHDPEGEHAMEEEEEEGAGAGAISSAILISLAAGALPPLALTARRREVGPAAAPERAEPRETAAKPVLLTVALLSLGAAVVHFAVIAQHFDEWWLSGLFFVAIATFQVAWAPLVLLRPSAPAYLAGAAVNAAAVVTWIVSRTSGVPVGPEAGEPEAVGFPDTLAIAFEVVLVAALLGLLGLGAARLSLAPFRRAASASIATAVVVSLTAAALVILA
jgi:hypothetical protein